MTWDSTGQRVLGWQVADTLGSVSSAPVLPQPFRDLPSYILLLSLAFISPDIVSLHIQICFIITFNFSFSVACISRGGFVAKERIIKHRFEGSRSYSL